MNRALPCSAPPTLITLLCPAHPEHPDNPDHSDTLITMITLTLPSPMLLFKRLRSPPSRRSAVRSASVVQNDSGASESENSLACGMHQSLPLFFFCFLIKFVATAGRTLQEQPRTSVVDISGGTTKQQPNVAGSLLLQWMLTSVE